MKKLLVATSLLLGLLALGLGAAFLYAEHAVSAAPGPVEQGGEVILTVPKGLSARGIGRLLQSQGLIPNESLWRYHLWRRGGILAKAGRFQVTRGMAIRELAVVLEGPPLPDDQPFVVVEGWRLRDTDAALVAAGLIKPGAYVAAANHPSKFTAPFPLPARSLEGYLYPETYRVPKAGLDVSALIQRQLDTFAERVYQPHKAELTQSGHTLHELVTMASMLEREEPSPEQRPMVAGILWKRISRGIPLGVDATSRYELVEWNDRKAFLEHLRDLSDAYNMRVRKGLPPTPIGAPVEASVGAALHPVPSEFLYYLHDSEKKLHPSRNAAEHEALRRRYNVY